MAVPSASNFCATPQFPVRLKRGRLADQPMEPCSNKRQYELLRRMPILKFKLDSGCFTVENMETGRVLSYMYLSKSKIKRAQTILGYILFRIENNVI